MSAVSLMPWRTSAPLPLQTLTFGTFLGSVPTNTEDFNIDPRHSGASWVQCVLILTISRLHKLQMSGRLSG